MPFDIQQDNSVSFCVEFLDSAGSLSVPPSATMTVTYIDHTFATRVDAVTLTLSGSFYGGVWSSTSAELGLATWVATTSLSSVQMATGIIRVLERNAG